MGANVTYIHKISKLAHDNGHAAIESRIEIDQFGLLSWSTCLTHLLGMSVWPSHYKGKITILKSTIPGYSTAYKYDCIYTIINI